MTLRTCSEGISYARELETASAAFYEELAKLFPADAERFTGYAAVNKKNISNVERAYYGVITDAIEGCFAFNIEPENYVLDLAVDAGTDRSAALAKALEAEATIIRFYTDAAEQAKGTMADVPRAFLMVARKRGDRVDELKSLAAS
jgi:rubrerythrin